MSSPLDSVAAAEEEEEATTDVEILRRVWRNEKAAPEILVFEAALISRVREQIQLLEETVEDLAACRGGNGDDIVISLYQMDIDRTLYLLRSYLRIRLQKIEKYTVHSMKPEIWRRLSQAEQRFAERCANNMEKHFNQAVLSKLPYGYQSALKQSISSENDDMVPEPELDTFVFCKTKTDVGAFQLDNMGEEVVDLVANDLYILRYKSIKGLIESGQVDLV